MSAQKIFEEFDWRKERPAFVKALPHIIVKVLGTATAFTAFFTFLLVALTTQF